MCTFMFSLPTQVIGCLSFVLVACHTKMLWSLVELPDCRLVHFGRREVLARIEAMEVEYDQPLAYVDPGPAVPGAEPIGDPTQPWGDGIVVWGTTQLQRCQQTPSLMADSYGFCGEEEWGRVQQYLKFHGGWQLEQVGVTGKSIWSFVVKCWSLAISNCWSLVHRSDISYFR